MAQIIPFRGITKLDLDPDTVLDNLKGQLEGFVIAGYDKEGREFLGATYGDAKVALWLLERCKARVLDSTEDEDT